MPVLNTSEMLSVGTMLDGRYRIEKYLASGGFGNTYVALDTRFNSRVAVKEFYIHGTNHRGADHSTVVVSNYANREGFEQQLNKFRIEAKRIFDLRKDHIVHVTDLFDANGTSYYIMDYIDGDSLSARVKSSPLSEDEAMDVITQLLEALGAVHAAGFYHLDVKPGNIMMDRRGYCTLIDFGASKQMSSLERTVLSVSGMAYTLGYAPPEQEMQRLKSIGPWTDIYAVGATLYNLLTGQRPPLVDADDADDDSRMFSYPAGVSDQTKKAISCMMNPSPRKRPQSVEQTKTLLGLGLVETVSTSPHKDEKDISETLVKADEPLEDSAEEHEGFGTTYDDETSSSGKWKLWVSLAAAVCLAAIIFFLIQSRGQKNATSSESLVAQSSDLKGKDSLSSVANGESNSRNSEKKDEDRTEKNTEPVIKKDDLVREDNMLRQQEERRQSAEAAIGALDVKGNKNAEESHAKKGVKKEDSKVEEKNKEEDSKIYEFVEQQASFPGGPAAMNRWLAQNIIYPAVAVENNIHGRVSVQFVVELNGSISNVVVTQGVDPSLDKEAVRVVKSMPKWTPGKQNGRPVRSKFTLPINFNLQ